MNYIFDVQFVGMVFALFVLMISLVYYAAEWRTRSENQPEGKRKPYMCGEEAKEEANMPHMGFYSTVVATMKFRKSRRLQSGDVSEYVLAVLAGIVFLLMILVFL